MLDSSSSNMENIQKVYEYYGDPGNPPCNDPSYENMIEILKDTSYNDEDIGKF